MNNSTSIYNSETIQPPFPLKTQHSHVQRIRFSCNPKNVPDKKLFRGDVGTIAFVYEGGGLYEVEFVNAAGDTVAVVTLTDTEICGVQLQSTILHVADLPT